MATQIRIYNSLNANVLQSRYLILVNNVRIMMCGKMFDMWSGWLYTLAASPPVRSEMMASWGVSGGASYQGGWSFLWRLVRTKHFPESKTHRWIQKHVPESVDSGTECGKCFWILGCVLRFWDVFWILAGAGSRFWDVLLDSGMRFGFWEVVCPSTSHRSFPNVNVSLLDQSSHKLASPQRLPLDSNNGKIESGGESPIKTSCQSVSGLVG